jgi:hypothetical protein
VKLGLFSGIFDTSLSWNSCSSTGTLVAVRSKAYVCIRWIAEIAGLNPIEDMASVTLMMRMSSLNSFFQVVDE